MSECFLLHLVYPLEGRICECRLILVIRRLLPIILNTDLIIHRLQFEWTYLSLLDMHLLVIVWRGGVGKACSHKDERLLRLRNRLELRVIV